MASEKLLTIKFKEYTKAPKTEIKGEKSQFGLTGVSLEVNLRQPKLFSKSWKMEKS